jgi:DNA-binding NtrC family response regulator
LAYGKAIDLTRPEIYQIAMSGLEKQIRKSIDAFVEELNALVRQAAVDAVKDALGADAAPARRSAGRTSIPGSPVASPPRRPRRGRRVKRSPRALARLQATLLDEIARNPGQRIEGIGRKLGVPTKDLNLPIKKLLTDNKIKKRGEKRATEYYVN